MTQITIKPAGELQAGDMPATDIPAPKMSAAEAFSPMARYLKATLIKSASGRYFIAVDGDLPKEAMFAEFCSRDNILTLKLDNHQTLTLLQNMDAEFIGNISRQKTIFIVRADDDTQKMKLPLVAQ